MRRLVQGILLMATSCQFLACSKPSHPPAPAVPPAEPAPYAAERSTLPAVLVPDFFIEIAQSQNEFVVDVKDPVRFANLMNDRADVVDGQVVALLGNEIRFQPNCRVVRESKIAVGQVTGLRLTPKIVLSRHLEARENQPPQKMVTILMNELEIGVVCKKPALALATEDFMWSDLEQALHGLIELRRTDEVQEPVASLRRCRRELISDVRRFERRAFNYIQKINVIAAQFNLTEEDLKREVEKQKVWSQIKQLRRACERFRRKWQPFRCRFRQDKNETYLDSRDVLLPCHRLAIAP